MSNHFSLDDIRAAAEAKYGSLRIDLDPNGKYLELLNPLKLDKGKRAELMALQKNTNDEDATEDQEETFSEMIRVAASNRDIAEEFLGMVGGDLTVLAEVLERYGKLVQVGEASASAS